MRRAEFEILKSRDRIDLLAPDFAVPTPEVVDPLVVKNTNDYNKQDGIHNGYEEYLDSFEEMMRKKEVVSLAAEPHRQGRPGCGSRTRVGCRSGHLPRLRAELCGLQVEGPPGVPHLLHRLRAGSGAVAGKGPRRGPPHGQLSASPQVRDFR